MAVVPQQVQGSPHEAMNLSNDEKTRKYVNVVCQDTELLLISSKVSTSLREVCEILKLDESEMEKIVGQEGDDCNKVYSAFVAWKDKCKMATWGELAQCISANHDLFQIVFDHLVISPPRIEAHPQRESEIGYTGSSEIVVGHVPNGVIDQPHLQVRKNLRELQDSFQDVLVVAQTALESQPNIVSKVRTRLASMCVDAEDNIPYFDEHMLTLITKTSIPDLFVLMLRMRLWDPVNFRALTTLVQKCLPTNENLHGEIERYSHEADSFKSKTLLRDYMMVCGSKKSLPYGCTTITVKFERSYTEYTMTRFAADQAFLANEFLLNESILHFKESQRGCISVTWLIPRSAVPLLEPPRINAKREALRQRKIVELVVDEKYIYRFPQPLEPPRPLSLSTSEPNYESMYEESINNPDKFWKAQANQFLKWIKPFHTVNDCVKEKGIVKWFSGGQLNVTVNCLDRHAEKDGSKPALLWEKNRKGGEQHGTHESVTYSQLLEMTCRMANVLAMKCGVKKGDRVIVYMPTCPMAVAAMLACARIGAVHCVLYSVLRVRDVEIRIKASDAKVVITATSAVVGDKVFPLQKNISEVLDNLSREGLNTVNHVLVAMNDDDNADVGKYINFEKLMDEVPTFCEAVPMDSEDPLFIMYTSGTTGEPTGVIHTQAGYLLYAAMTHKYVFDYNDGEVFACVSVLGWITGHTYVVYGPLCNGATTVLFEGTATYPDCGRYWEMVDRLKVNHFYTTPSAIRKLMKANQNCTEGYDLSSLKTIASVGEPLPTAAWKWYYKNVGKEKCILVDTYWQTELGGIVLSPQPGPSGSMLKPGTCTRPFFGVEPVIVDQKGTILPKEGVQGLLCLKNPIPGMARKLLSGKDFNQLYFQTYPGLYFTRDWSYRDIDGDYQIVGRQDDIIRIKGVWIHVPEIESYIANDSDKIENVSIIRLQSDEKDESSDHQTGVVVELSSVGEKKFYQEILNCIKQRIIHFAGLSALPKFVVLVKQNIETWSEKTCRSIWRYIIMKHYLAQLKLPDHSNMIALLDLSNSPLPMVADSHWQSLCSSRP